MQNVKPSELNFREQEAALEGRFSQEELDDATEVAESIGLPLQKLLMRMDAINSEILALSFLAHTHWRNTLQAGEQPDTSDFALTLAPIMHRIYRLSDEMGGHLVGTIGADSQLNRWPSR